MTRSRGALAAGAVVLALVAAASALAWRDGSPLRPSAGGTAADEGAPLFLALLAVALAAYLAGLWLLRRRPPSLGAVVALALAVQLVPLAAPLLLSTDAWTYWAYGRSAAVDGGNPYRDPPSEFPSSPAYPLMGADWRDRTTVYGPAFTLASEPLALAAGSSSDAAAWQYKGLAAFAASASVLLASRLARRRALAAAFVGWNPVLAVHLAGGGHNDAWVGALVLAALALARAGRARSGGAVWAAAIAVKWVPVVFLALAALEARATGRRVGLAGLALGGASLAALGTWRYGLAWLDVVEPLAENAALETSYALPHRLEQLGLGDAAAAALAVVVLGAGLVLLGREAARGRAKLGLAACLVLAVTPYLIVWYLAWAVPVAGADEERWGRLGCLAFTAYLLPQTIPL
ncbi:MAG TPA: glycosyltransferase 87 family protein [Gaiellaceae bacterium]|nr:glycosyltransferase 87 family protein [Gaiellaceae bacterium]